MAKQRDMQYPPETREKIGFIAWFVRSRRGITQQELSRFCNLAQPEISAIEKASPKASQKNISLILRALSINHDTAILPSCYAALTESAIRVNNLSISTENLKTLCFVFDSYFSMLPARDIEIITTVAQTNYPSCFDKLLTSLNDKSISAIFSKFSGSIYYVYTDVADPWPEFCRQANLAIPDYFATQDKLEQELVALRFKPLEELSAAQSILSRAMDNILTDSFKYTFDDVIKRDIRDTIG